MLLLEQKIIKRWQIYKIKFYLEFNNGRNNNDKKYKVRSIRDCEINTRVSKNQLLAFYYLISLKSYSKVEKQQKINLDRPKYLKTAQYLFVITWVYNLSVDITPNS